MLTAPIPEVVRVIAAPRRCRSRCPTGYITDITVLSTDDDARFFNSAESSVISQILSSQSVSVDTVSGATFSSNGIIAAVTDALSGALGTTTSVTVSTGTTADTDTSITSAQMTTETTETTTSSGSGPIAKSDGTYTGTGTGFRGEATVSVTVEDGYITSISVTAYNDDEKYFSRAESTIISRIITGQTPDVDAVSGATYSSNGIMEAVANALDIEYTSTTPVGGNQGGHGHH